MVAGCSGAFATVKLGTRRSTGTKVAIKIIDKARAKMLAMSHDVDELLKSEVATWRMDRASPLCVRVFLCHGLAWQKHRVTAGHV